MMSRFMTNYLGVNTVPGQQPQQAHPQQQPHHGLQLNPVALAQHPPSQQSAAQGQQSQSQMKSQSHTEHYTTPVMSQQNQQMHGPQTNAPHYRIVQSAPSSAFQAGPMQGPPQNQNQQHSQQISGNAMRGMPPSSSTPPQQQQSDVLTKMGQHYQMTQMPPPSQPPNPSQQSRGGGYRPPSNINNRNRINPQHTPLIYNYTPPFVVPQVNSLNSFSIVDFFD